MKKIAVIANAYYNIANFRSELIKEMLGRGYSVHILCPRDKWLDFEKTEFPFEEIYLNRGGINPLSDLRTVLSIGRSLKRIKPDIVLNYTVKPAIYGSIAARIFSRASVFSNITGLGYAFTGGNHFVRIIVTRLYKISLSLNKLVFFQNPDDARLFQEEGIVPPERRFILNGSGVNLSKFSQNTTDVKTPMSFIFVGRLLIDKGVRELLHAFKKVKEEFPQAVLRLVGDIDQNPKSLPMKELNEFIDKGIVEFLGRLEDVRPELLRSQVFVLPSYREGTPRSTLEAMAMALPLVTTNVPGCRETVIPGKNGFLVKEKDIDTLAEAMVWFCRNQSQVSIMGKMSLDYVREKYDVDQVNSQILSEMKL